MNTVIGPTRLVVIRSGKYDYGEIDLTAPVHLVGPNNVGKTSLIALLQLLYVDNQNQMSFSRPLDESKRYYFPDTSSYVLFEVLTPTGFWVLGAHGLGKVKRNDFERFAYQGRFDADDFLDQERRVREVDEVRRRLAPRGFTTLEPKHLQAALTGIGDGKGVHLGLVPLRDRNQYDRFRALFQHLLRLAQIRQAELKALLLEIYKGQFRQPSIELGREVAEQLRIIRKSQGEVRDLKALQPTVKRLLEAAAARDAARAPLPALWRQLGTAAADEERVLTDALSTLDRERSDLSAQEADRQEALRSLERDRTEVIKRTARLEDALARLESGKARFKGYVPEFKEQELATLDEQIAALDVRLHTGRTEDAADVDRRLSHLRRRHADLARRLANLAGSVGVRVTDLLPDAGGREAVFKLLDPGLLQLSLGKDGFAIVDETALRRWLESLQRRLADGVFEGCGVRVDLSARPEPDLGEFLDSERIASDLAAAAGEIDRLEEAARSIAEIEAIRGERSGLRDRRDQLIREIAAWGAHMDDLADESTLITDLAAAKAALGDLESAIKGTRESLGALESRRHEITREQREAESTLRALHATLDALDAPDPQWPDAATESPDTGGLAFADLATRYQHRHAEQRRHQERVQDQLRVVEERTYGAYAAVDEAAVIERLRAEMAALPDKEAATDEMWRTLAVGLRSAFKALWQDLETLKSLVAGLNRQLSQVTVSNLEQVKLVIEDRPEWGRRLRDMLDFEDMPLFADPVKANAAVDEIGKLLDQHQRVELADLFGLQFEVTTVGGRTLHYQNLDSVESNGTTITMKVLINVLLLRELLNRDDVQVPYYLDEASSLDQDNLAAIVRYSRERGFVPVLASPDPMEAAEHLYFVSERNGRVVLDPELSRVTLRRRNRTEGQPEATA